MKRIGILLIGLACIAAALPSSGQADKKKAALKVGLVYTRVNDEAPVLKFTSKVKVGKKFESVGSLEINLFFMEETKAGFLGRVKTSRQGTGSFTLPANVVSKLDSLSPFKFVATFTASDLYEDASTEIEITRARIDLTLSEADSVKKVSARVFSLKDAKWAPEPQVEVKLFVKRLFADFPVGEATYTTDAAGEASADFKLTIPGDGSGNLILGSKIDDSDLYGTISATKPAKWGVPLKEDKSFYERSLFASRDKTPIWLLVFPNVVIATVWGLIFYLFILIRRIRRIGIANKNI